MSTNHRPLRHYCHLSWLTFMLASVVPLQLTAAWSTFHGNDNRSSTTTETLNYPLSAVWRYDPVQPPQPAYPEPGRELNRMDFDYVFHPVVADGIVAFGSSADDTVRALALADGKQLWQFTTGAPVRFAPVFSNGKIYITSDDGTVYCRDARTGNALWQFVTAPADEWMVGSNRMMSKWPLRSGVIVEDGMVYVVAGMFPSHGVYVYALDAESGAVVWKRDRDGFGYMSLSHKGSSGFNGVAPHGYMLSSANTLIVPTGRSVPAVFDRSTGRLNYYYPGNAKNHGGTWCAATDDFFFNQAHLRNADPSGRTTEASPIAYDGIIGYGLNDGFQKFVLKGRYLGIAADNTLYCAGFNGVIEAIDINAYSNGTALEECTSWQATHARAYRFAIAGDTLLVGGWNTVTAFDRANGNQRWKTDVSGHARGLAIAEGRLLVATQDGQITCYASGNPSAPIAVQKAKSKRNTIVLSDSINAQAQAIISATKKRAGYALVLGAEDSRLATALVQQSDLHVTTTLTDRNAVASARHALISSGLYGSRIVVHHQPKPTQLRYPPYFADLIVVASAIPAALGADIHRVLRPFGGILHVPADADGKRVLEQARAEDCKENANHTMLRRGQLPDSDDWRYHWADAGNSAASDEKGIRPPFNVLWYGEPGPGFSMNKRFFPSSPLCVNGRMFLTGDRGISAFDAFNGRQWWNRKTGLIGREWALNSYGNLVADSRHLYLARQDRCHRYDQRTGDEGPSYFIPDAVLTAVADAAEEAPSPLPRIQMPTNWHVYGPFPASTPVPKVAPATVVESISIGSSNYRPKVVKASRGHVNLAPFWTDRGAAECVWALTEIDCPKPKTLQLGVGATGPTQWYVDGKQVANYQSATPLPPYDYYFDVELTAGRHVIAVRVAAGDTQWQFAYTNVGNEETDAPDMLYTDRLWTYLAVVNDRVIGGYARPFRTLSGKKRKRDRYTKIEETAAIFALDRKSGKLAWVYPTTFGVFRRNIACSDDAVFIADSRTPYYVSAEQRRGRWPEPSTVRKMVVLDIVTGEQRWSHSDIPVIGESGVQYKDGVLVVGGRNKKGNEIKAAYDATTGQKIWQNRIRSAVAPIAGDRIVSQKLLGYDFKTGQGLMNANPITGNEARWKIERTFSCGPMIGSPDMLLYRSGATAFHDLDVQGTTHFGVARTGCSITGIIAHRLVLLPEGNGGCACSYNYQASFALMPVADAGDHWFLFANLAETGRFATLNLNFNAPGDRRDSDGGPWFGMPRPQPVLKGTAPFPARLAFDEESGYARLTRDSNITGTDMPWVYSSHLEGEGTIHITTSAPANAATDANDGIARLHFLEHEELPANQRVFDVVVNGQTVLSDFDIVSRTGRHNVPLVIDVPCNTTTAEVTVALRRSSKSNQTKLPIICGLELIANGATQ